MSRVYRSAQGRIVDMEKLRIANEDTIAVGNMRVNARGDQLGPGGKVVKPRNQIMKEYYALNTPVSDPNSLESDTVTKTQNAVRDLPEVIEPELEMSSLDREMLDIDQEVPEPEPKTSKTKSKKEQKDEL